MDAAILTERELSEVLKCSVAALRVWRRTKGLPCLKFGRLIRYELPTVLAWFESQSSSQKGAMS